MLHMRLDNTLKGKLPPLQALTSHQWTGHQTSGTTMRDNVDGGIDIATATGTPTSNASPILHSKKFNGSSQYLTSADIDEAISGSRTLNAFIKPRAGRTGTETIFHYGGNGTAGAAENLRFQLKLTSTDAISVVWQTGTNTNQTYTTTWIMPTMGWWWLITIKKVKITTGFVDLQLWVNGRFVETFATNVAEYASGANAYYRMAANGTGGGIFDGEISFIQLDAKVNSDEHLHRTVRGLILLDGDSDVHATVEVKNSVGTYQDLSDLEGEDFLTSIRITDSVDALVQSFTVTCAANIDKHSLCFLRSDSKFNLTDVDDPDSFAAAVTAGRDIRIKFARMPLFVSPVAANFHTYLEGEIDKVTPSGPDSLQLQGRDKGAELSYNKIETPTWYSDLGTPAAPVDDDMEDIIQMILDDWAESTPVLRVADAISFGIHGYEQQMMSCHEAIQNMALQRAALCRYKWYASDQAHHLTLHLPGSDRTGADFVLTPDDYYSISTIEVERTRVRNRIKGGFYDDTTTDNQGNPAINDNLVEDTPSQTAFGKQFMSFTEASTSQIDTLAELNTMLNAALDALKDPEAVIGLSTKFIFELDINNIIKLAPNREMWNEAQYLAVQQASLSWARRQKTTTLAMRGQPTAGHRAFLQREAGPSEYPSVTGPIYPVAADISLDQLVGGVRVSFPAPSFLSQQKQRDRYSRGEVHVKQQAGTFTPDSTTLAAFGDKSDFEVNDLLPGVEYRVQFIPLDGFGRPGTACDLGAITTKRAGSAYMDDQGRADGRNNLLGQDFNAFTRGDGDSTVYAPDFWNVDGGTWGQDFNMVTTADSNGPQTLELFDNGNAHDAALESDLVPVERAKTYAVWTRYLEAVARAGGEQWDIDVDWYQGDGTTLVSTSTLSPADPSSASFTSDADYFEAPSNAKFARIRIHLESSTGTGSTWKVVLDYMKFVQVPNSVDAYRSGLTDTVADATWTKIDFATITTRRGPVGAFASGSWRSSNTPQLYQVDFCVELDGTITAGSWIMAELREDTSSTVIARFAPSFVFNDGDDRLRISGSVLLYALNGVEVFVKHNGGATLDVVNGAVTSYMRVAAAPFSDL